MLVLAIDTSSAAVTAALSSLDGDEPNVRAEHVTINARGHGEYLAPAIAAVLSDARCAPRDLGAIVVGTGPGPFTGLRVGLVTAAVMGETLGIPTYGICSLDAIAGALAGLDDALLDGGLLVASDARRKEVYWARYDHGVRTVGPEVSRPADVPTSGIRAMAGVGARLYAHVLGARLLDRDYPSGPALVRCALDRIRSAAPADPLNPLYLRRPDAIAAPTSKAVTQ